MYIDDFEVSQELLAQTSAKKRRMTVSVKADFPVYVSAWQLTWTLPEHVSMYALVTGTTYDLTYMDKMENEITFTPGMSVDANNPKAIAAVLLEQGYYYEEGMDPDEDDPLCYGNPKWLGQYEDYLQMTLQFDQEFTGGDLILLSEPSCTDDPRGPISGNTETTKVCHITVESTAEPAPVPTFVWSEDSYTMEAVCEGHTVVLMINGEAVENPYTVTQTYEEQNITFTAYTVANEGESANSAIVTSETVTVPAKAKTPSNKPSVVVTPGDDVYTIEATGTGEVELYVNGEKVDNPYTINRPAYGEADITVTVKASNLDSDEFGEIQYEIAWSADQEVVVPAKDPEYYQTPDPVITVTVDNDAQTVTITATGEGTVTLKVTGATGTVGETSGAGTCSVVVPFGEDVDYVNAYATATAAGEFVYPGDATENMIEIPAKPETPEPGETKTFVKVTAADQLVAGKNYIFVCGDYAMGSEATGNFLLPIAITGGDEVEVGDNVAILTLGGSAGHWTLALGDQYLTAGNSTNLGFGTTATEWVITNNEGALAGFRAKHADYTRAIRKHNSMDRFGNYSTSDVNSEFAWIYVEKSDEPVLPTLGGYFVWSTLDEEGHFTVAYNNFDYDGDYTLVVKDEDGNVINPEVGDAGEYYQAAEGTHTYTAEVTATGYQPKTEDHVYTYTVPTYAPAPVLDWNETTFTMTATLNRAYTDADIELYMENELVENPKTVAQTYVEQTITFKARTIGKDGDENSEWVYKTVTVPAKETTPSATPVITVTPGDDAYTISATPAQTVTLTDGDGNELDNPYVVNRPEAGQEDLVIYVTATNDEGEGHTPTSVTQRVVIPAKVAPVLPVMPTVETETTDAAVIVTATTTDGATVVLYQCDENGENAQAIDNPASFLREATDRTVYVYAVATNEDGSTTTEVIPVLVPAKAQEPDPTSINEMNGGKAIANVRYFNMAGQEMQEANGMTIVVTTYTDGTTSAVKVMK